MSEAFTFDGICEGRPARLRIDEAAILLERPGGGEPARRIALAEGVEVSLADRGPASPLVLAGALLAALGALWAADRAVAWPVCALSGALGVALLMLGLRLRVAVVRVSGPQGAVALACRGRSRRIAREAVAALREAKPGQARKPSASIVQFMLGEASAIGASEARLRREYRLLAGEDADPVTEERFLRARRTIAFWNLLWAFFLPLALAVVAAALGAIWGAAQAAVAGLVAFAGLVFVGLKLLPRLQRMLAKVLE